MELHILLTAKQYFGNPDLVRLSVELARRKHHISVVTSLREGDKEICMKGLDVYVAPHLVRLHNLGYPLSFPISQLYKIVNGKGIEIIHALSDFSTHTASATLVSTIKKVPFVYTIQGIGWETNHLVSDALMKLYELAVQRLIARRADKVILLSRRLMPRARKLGVKENKTVVVPPGIDCSRFNPERLEIKEKAASLMDKLGLSGKTVIGYVGRLIFGKGLPYLISAIEQAKNRHPSLILLIVGDGPERTSLERMAKNAGISAIFLGWQNDILPYYSIIDVFVLPSLFEGVPNVLLEAMAMKKAVVATNVGANADLIENGVNGFLVPVQDSQQITSALEKLVENSEIRYEYGRISREKVVKFFSLDETVKRVERVYSEIV